MQINDNEIEAKTTTNLLNIAKKIQGVAIVTSTKTKCPFSPTPYYYVKMPCSPTTRTTNPKLVMNLEDPCFESHDLNVSYQTQ